MTLYRDVGLRKMQREAAVAAGTREGGAERNSCVAAERHFGRGREVANVPAAVSSRRGERGLGKSDLRRDALHLGWSWHGAVAQHDACGVAAGRAVGEGCNALHVHIGFLG